VSTDQELLGDSAEELFEDAPCGYLATSLDGTIIKVNRTFESWTGLGREQLLTGRRFQDLLSPGGRIYYETHFSPLLQMQGSVKEIAVEIIRADGSRLPALVNSVLRNDELGRPRLIRTTVFDATDRRRYEQELLLARRREREVAQLLQRSLLAGELPSSPRLELAVAYQPGMSDLEVGGDWYDAFWLDDEDLVGLVVGDVVGHGIEAAASMGQLRSAVRALAAPSLRPAELLGALDRYARRHRVGQMTTLVYAQLNIRTGELSFACAGHPPPLILGTEGQARFAWDGRSLPLDAHLSAGERAQGTIQVSDGDTVLFYTDGLIERRTRSLDEGMDRLLAEASTHREQPTTRLLDGVLRTLHDAEHTDDVCLLAARLKRR
jgi:phosphoserine phosphatase RsbU/P